LLLCSTIPEAKAEALEILTQMRDDASRNFKVYGRELGLDVGAHRQSECPDVRTFLQPLPN
jgi:hypothetical protein